MGTVQAADAPSPSDRLELKDRVSLGAVFSAVYRRVER